MLKSCKVLGVLALLLAGPILFQQVARADIAMELLGTPNSNIMGGVYTSPYELGVGGNPPSVQGTPMNLVCDDFTTEISTGEIWSANVYSIMDVTGTGPQKFQHTPNPVTIPGVGTSDYTIQQQYNAVAWLAEQLLDGSLGDTSTSYQAAIDSFAIWQIFDSTAVDGYGGNVLSSSEQTDVANEMLLAFSQTQLNYNVYIYTPNPADSAQEFLGISQNPLTQPFIFPTPEGSTLTLLAFNSLALLGIVLFVRRRRINQNA